MSSLASVVAALFLLVALNVVASAQPNAQFLFDALADQAPGPDDPFGRYAWYVDMEPLLEQEAAADSSLEALLAILRSDVMSDMAAAYSRRGMESLLVDEPERFSWAVRDFVGAAYFNQQAGLATRKDMYQLGEALDRLNSGGMSLAELRQGMLAELLETVDTAIKLYKAEQSLEDLAKSDAPERARFVNDMLDLVPASLHPFISGPMGVAFAQALDWQGEMSDTISQAVNLVGDAQTTGQLDMARYRVIEARIKALAGQGPWDGAAAVELFKKWVEGLPVMGKFIKAVWPVPVPPQCRPINCDCDNLPMELFGEFRRSCLIEEEKLMVQCRATGVVAGICHPTASGPDAFPQ